MTASPGFETLGDPASPRSVWFLHGILGRGRNWRSFARRVVDTFGWRAVLPDLRGHGEAPPRPGPHDLHACAADLAELAAHVGPPEVLVGHSFGGKVALVALREAALPARATWVLDSPPGAGRRGTIGPSDPERVLAVLRTIPTPAPDREALRAPLRAAGVAEPVVQWLLTSARQDADGWRWVWDLDGVEEMLRSYVGEDLWPFLETTDREIHLLRAGRSERWTDEQHPLAPHVTLEVMPDVGHWLHVEAPDRTFAMLAPSFSG